MTRSRKPAEFRFRLYIVGHAPNSVRAVTNLIALCRQHLPDRHHIEIVDVLLEPQRGLADKIMLTPSLVKYSPTPLVTIIGNLSDDQIVLQSLGIAT
jgi:circadian clock protein KaiB